VVPLTVAVVEPAQLAVEAGGRTQLALALLHRFADVIGKVTQRAGEIRHSLSQRAGHRAGRQPLDRVRELANDQGNRS